MAQPPTANLAGTIRLRDVTPADFPIFFDHQLDTAANQMAAFTAKDPADRDAFIAHWTKTLRDPTIVKQTILRDGHVAGNIVVWNDHGDLHVGYWIGRSHWGKGVATAALSHLLRQVTTRPLHSRVAKDNLASLRVLAKCGFVRCGEDKGFSNARGREVEEVVLILHQSANDDVS